MIEHVVLFRLRPEVSDQEVESLIETLTGLAGRLPEVESFHLSRDAGLRAGNEDLGIVATFRDRGAFEAYMSHPEHLELLRTRAGAMVASKHSLQIDIPG